MKTINLFLLMLIILSGVTLEAQVGINADNTMPDSSAMLDVKSTDKGMLIPRMTKINIEAITSPANALIVFNTTDDKFYTYIESEGIWKEIAYGSGTITPGGNYFPCGELLIDERDNQEYATIQIGSQCWMAENLNIGNWIYSGLNSSDNGYIEKYCYNDIIDSCDVYGGLYQWNEMMQYVTTEGAQGICTPGWHLPTDEELCILENAADSDTIFCGVTGALGIDAGGNLKEAGFDHWVSPNIGATNLTGFTLLPGGYRNQTGTISSHGYVGYVWSSSEDGTKAWYRNMDTFSQTIYRNSIVKDNGYGVRCLKD